MSKRGLGKGLDALLSTSSLAREKLQTQLTQSVEAIEGEFLELPVTQLTAGVYQPRKAVHEQALAELASSIQSQGIIQPIIVRPLTNPNANSVRYEIIAGERRWRAAKQAGLTQVPCLVKKVDDKTTIAMALIENIQREDLNAIEEAQALERLQAEFQLTHQQVADVIGKSRTAVSNLLRLNQLTDQVKFWVEEKQLEMGHARALLALEDDIQIELAERVIRKQLTVRQTEQLVKKQLSEPVENKLPTEDQEIQLISQRLGEKLAGKVTIVRNDKGHAKITIHLDAPQKLQQLINKIEQ